MCLHSFEGMSGKKKVASAAICSQQELPDLKMTLHQLGPHLALTTAGDFFGQSISRKNKHSTDIKQ